MLLGGQLMNPSLALEQVLSAPAPKQEQISIVTKPMTGRLGNGVVQRAVIKVLEAKDGPMKLADIHTGVEKLLGRSVSKESVGWCLRMGSRGSNARFERVKVGWYIAKHFI
jgi:hypothetical protein